MKFKNNKIVFAICEDGHRIKHSGTIKKRHFRSGPSGGRMRNTDTEVSMECKCGRDIIKIEDLFKQVLWEVKTK